MKSRLIFCVLTTVLVTATSAFGQQQIDPAFHSFWMLNVEKSDFGSRPKLKMGFVNWGEHGWAPCGGSDCLMRKDSLGWKSQSWRMTTKVMRS